MRPHRRLAALLALLPPAFACNTPATTGSTTSAASASASVSSAPVLASAPASASASASVRPAPKVHSPQCPAGMVEVKGVFCQAVLHKCIKGGSTYKGKPDGSWMPYFCEQYEEGYARCMGRQEPKHFCMDEFEFPNVQGEIPRVMVTWTEAKARCEEQGKRLCGDDEWTLACEGPDRRPFAYGWARDATACNIDRPWIKPNDGILASTSAEKVAAEVDRLSQRVPSGSMPGCTSPYGAMDLGGNVDEWTVNVTLGGKPYKSMFKGGHWCKGARNRCRPTTESHDESTAYYAEGFRCCSNILKK